MKNIHKINQNIYITSDEKIKKRDWCINSKNNNVMKVGHHGHHGYSSKKIILTTDQYLIRNSVQAINDEFLEWFIKNPSCEEVKFEPLMAGFIDDEPSYYENMYEIIIPKQETLEEALTAEEFFRNKIKENIEWEGEITLWKVPLNAELSMRWAKEYSDYVIKWQQERSYSEEEVLEFTQTIIQQYKLGNTNIEQLNLLKETLQKFKNK